MQPDTAAIRARADEAYRSLRLSEALSAYQQWAEADPGSYEAALGMTRTLTRMRRTQEAHAAASGLLDLDPTRWEGHAALGTLHFLTDHYDDAREALRRAEELAPTEPEPRLTMAQLLADTGDYTGAHTALNQGRALIGATRTDAAREEMDAFALHVETYVLLAEGRDAEATATAQRVVAMRDANPHAATLAYSNLGILAARSRNLDEAIEYLEQAYAMNPCFHRAAGALGQILFVRQRYDRAAEVLGHVVANASAPDGPTHYAYGLTLSKLGRRQDAQEQFRLALSDGGLRGMARFTARWQVIWQGTWGRVAVIGVLLALVAAWIYWAQPDPQTLTLAVVIVAGYTLQNWLRTRKRK